MIPSDNPVLLLNASMEKMDLSELHSTYDRIFYFCLIERHTNFHFKQHAKWMIASVKQDHFFGYLIPTFALLSDEGFFWTC